MFAQKRRKRVAAQCQTLYDYERKIVVEAVMGAGPFNTLTCLTTCFSDLYLRGHVEHEAESSFYAVS